MEALTLTSRWVDDNALYSVKKSCTWMKYHTMIWHTFLFQAICSMKRSCPLQVVLAHHPFSQKDAISHAFISLPPNSLLPETAFQGIHCVHLYASCSASFPDHQSACLDFSVVISQETEAALLVSTLADIVCCCWQKKHWSFYSWWFPSWTMQCCVLSSVSIFLVAMWGKAARTS